MRELPIIFSSPMVRAILEGRKTHTRRLVKPQPPDGWGGTSARYALSQHARYKIGDHLWTKEAYAIVIPGCPNGITYRSDHDDPKGDGPTHPIKWKSPLFMPKKFARLWLEVKNVRCERLRDITEEDAIAEGAVFVDFGKDQWGNQLDGWKCGDRPTDYEECLGMAIFAFANCWNSIHGPDAWEENPWVFVYELRRIEK